jgi:hypothetical protein
MRQQLGDECRVRASHRKSRVRLKPGDKGVARMLSPPALVIAKCSVADRRWNKGERHSAALQRARGSGGVDREAEATAMAERGAGKQQHLKDAETGGR